MGNIFLGDDGFGVEVGPPLAGESRPDYVPGSTSGIRGIHLAYELLDSYEAADPRSTPRRGARAGTVYLIEPDLEAPVPAGGEASDAHGMNPAAVFGLLRKLGGRRRTRLDRGMRAGASTDEEIGLSEPVARAVDDAVRLTLELINGQPA